jgi:DNA mismatch repair ATPase MutS
MGKKQNNGRRLVEARQIRPIRRQRKTRKRTDFAEVLTAQQANVSTDVSNALSELRDKMAGILSKAEFGKTPT